jgi:predicted dehydrogenase
MVNVGVIGTGSIGVHHARIFSDLHDANLVGIVDINTEKASEIASKYKCKAYESYLDIMEMVDAVSIAVPTTLHYQIGMEFLRHNKHLLIEKPITTTIEEAKDLIREADKRNLKLQVGHLERFNAGVSMISDMVKEPKFIESQRLSPFLGRGTDVDVTLDLMIHDIDIILSLVNSHIVDLRATGARVLTDNIDVAHAWIEFENGCIAEAVTSRIATEKVSYLKHGENVDREIKRPEQKEPLKEQLLSFIDCIKNDRQPIVSGHEGREALKVVLKVSGLVNHGLTL